MVIKRNKDKMRKKKKAKSAGGLQSGTGAADNADGDLTNAGGGNCEPSLEDLLQDTQTSEATANGAQLSELNLLEDSEQSESALQSEQLQQLPATSELAATLLTASNGECINITGASGITTKLDLCDSAQGKLESAAAAAGGVGSRQHHHERVKEDTFCCVISMHDGIVLYTTPSITDVLGFPRDMWLGRSFIDFVHHKDRATFASQITTGIPIAETRGSTPKDARSTFCVMLRRYRGLTSGGFGVIGRPVNYEPFRLGLTFREAPEEARPDNYLVSNGTNMLLVISATPIKSSYKGTWCRCSLSLLNPHFHFSSRRDSLAKESQIRHTPYGNWHHFACGQRLGECAGLSAARSYRTFHNGLLPSRGSDGHERDLRDGHEEGPNSRRIVLQQTLSISHPERLLYTPRDRVDQLRQSLVAQTGVCCGTPSGFSG